MAYPSLNSIEHAITAVENGTAGSNNKKKKKKVFRYESGTTTPLHDTLYVTLRGYGTDRSQQVAVMCGDEPPTITDGYAKWSTVDRPLRTGITTFQGYNPAKMTLSLRFGEYTGTNTAEGGWGRDSASGVAVENKISILSWMAGANFGSGHPPVVYVNSYGKGGASTGLVPWDYQDTVGAGSFVDHRQWPWVIDGGIQWGTSLRNSEGNRVYQECTLSLLNYLSFTKPSTHQAKGSYIKTTTAMDTIYKIAIASHAINVDSVASEIKQSSQNNPVKGTQKHLNLRDHPGHTQIGKKGKSYEIWVPSHVV